MRLFIFGIIGLLCFACNNKKDAGPESATVNNKDSLLRLLTYGLSSSPAQTADVQIARQYGFCYYPVSGCVMTKDLLDSINTENKKVYQALAEQYGNDWKTQYTKKVDSLSSLFIQVKEMVSIQPRVQQLCKKEDGLYYHIESTDTANIFNVQAFSNKANNADPYIMLVNLHTHKVSFIK